MAVLPRFKDLSYYELANLQYEAFVSLKKSHDRLKVFVIALFIAIIGIGIGSYMGYKDFKVNVEPEIEQTYPVPVERLKEV